MANENSPFIDNINYFQLVKSKILFYGNPFCNVDHKAKQCKYGNSYFTISFSNYIIVNECMCGCGTPLR